MNAEVIIIGGGAGGLMCAFLAAQRGRRVLVLERANKVGKKILMSGGGRCNFTNLDVEPAHYICHNPHFVISALSRYTQWDFLELVGKHHIAFEQRQHGQLFCLQSARDILAMLLAECQTAGVQIHTGQDICRVQFDATLQQFCLQSQDTHYQCASLVVATGGLSIPTLGGSGFGYEIARQFGHRVHPTRAGLVPFTFTSQFKAVTERLSGIATRVNLFNEQASFTENLLFTHRGLSGPCALQLSNYWPVGSSIFMDFFVGMELAPWLIAQKQQQPKSLVRTVLQQYLAKNLVIELQLMLWPERSEVAIGQWPDKALAQLARQLTHFEQKPSGTEGYRTAEVTLGGVDTAEISSKTMQSMRQKGLYFIGEVLDVTGQLGGYNFQWAWSSAYAAAQAV